MYEVKMETRNASVSGNEGNIREAQYGFVIDIAGVYQCELLRKEDSILVTSTVSAHEHSTPYPDVPEVFHNNTVSYREATFFSARGLHGVVFYDFLLYRWN